MGKSGNPAKAAEQAKPADPVEYDPDPVDADGVTDFDEFWDSQDRQGRRVKVFGQVVTLPPALPLKFELEAKALQRSKDDRDMRTLVGTLFGAGALDQWVKSGMDSDQFKLLLAWAPQVIAGEDVTLAQVAQMIADAEANEDGEDPDPS